MMTRIHHGITLMELLVTIAVMGLVLALLGFPLYSAFSYVQKATARGEAQRAGLAAARRLSRDLGQASYVFDIPPDGSWVTFLVEPGEDNERSLGMGMNFESSAICVRYARLLDFPFQASGTSWSLLRPNYDASATIFETYAGSYLPFHNPSGGGGGLNPYILARYEEVLSWDRAWASAVNYTLNGSYPMSGYDLAKKRTSLLRQYRNDMVAVTPYGDNWDVSRFTVSPRRVSSESLTMQVDAQHNRTPGVLLSRYPLWAGRNRDLDEYAELTTQDGYPFRSIFGKSKAEIGALIRPAYPLYPLDADGSIASDTNPFGYQIRVFDQVGSVQYAASAYNAVTKFYDAASYNRHYMEWPPIDRPDWDEAYPLWTADDIQRQRLEGKVVFQQPMRFPGGWHPTSGSTYLKGTSAILPIPGGTNSTWSSAETRLISPPRRVLFSDGTDTRAFKLVDKKADALATGEFCVVSLTSRTVAFGDELPTNWRVRAEDARLPECQYTICDLQKTDVVVATYSTKAVLDVALTVSRRDHATRSARQSRQDYTTNMRIEARNAVKRARDGE